MRTFKGRLSRCGSGLYYYFWFFFSLIATVWNPFEVEVDTDQEEVEEADIEAATEDTEEMVGAGDGGHLIGGPSYGMTMNKTET